MAVSVATTTTASPVRTTLLAHRSFSGGGETPKRGGTTGILAQDIYSYTDDVPPRFSKGRRGTPARGRRADARHDGHLLRLHPARRVREAVPLAARRPWLEPRHPARRPRHRRRLGA